MYHVIRVDGIRSGLAIWYTTIVLLLGSFYANGQYHNLYFNSFKVKDGLPNNSVIAITQDTSGYIWAITKYGLCRYDGINFKTFTHENGNAGSPLTVSALKDIKPDNYGRLWIASRELELYHPETETFQKIPTGVEGMKVIYCDSKNRLFLGARGNLIYFETGNLKATKAIHLGIDKNSQVNVLCEDAQHHLWVGTSSGVFQVSFLKQKPTLIENAVTRQFYGNDVTALTMDKNQDLWIGTRANGIYRYGIRSGVFESFAKSYPANNSLLDNHIRKIISAKDGTLWIGTQEGLSVFNINTRTFYNFQHDSSNPHSLSDNSIFDIFQDKAGSVWIGTYFGGLNVVHTGSAPFTVFQNSAYKNSLSNNVISAITEDAHHNLWIGTEVSGLNFWNRQTGRFSVFKNDVKYKNSISYNLIKAIAIDQQGEIYIGTATGGLNLYHPSTNKFDHYWYTNQKTVPDISGDDVSSVLVTDKNEILVGTGRGPKFFLKTQGRFISPDTTADHIWVTTLFEDRSHIVWIGAANGFYTMTAAGRVKHEVFFNSSSPGHSPLTSQVNCLQEDNSGRLWAGLYYQGLAMLDKQKHTFRLFTTQDGLPGNNVLGILVDAANNLWVSTDNGLSKFDVLHDRFQKLTIEDGLPDNQFNKGSYYKQNDSTFFFGTYNGLVSFNPAKIFENNIPPKIVFSYVNLFNKPLSINEQHHLLKGDNRLGSTQRHKCGSCRC